MFIDMAQTFADDPAGFLLFRMEGKHPLFMWLIAPFLLIMDDPLMAGRMASVLTGLVTLAGIMKTASLLFSSRAGWTAGLVWILCPYALFYERLAQVESLLAGLGIWTLFTCIKISRGEWGRGGFAGLGILLGMAFYTKATAVLLFPLPILVFLILGSYRRDGFWRNIVIAYALALAVVIPLFMYGREVGFFSRTAVWQLPVYFMPLDKILSFPWEYWYGNTMVAGEFILAYLTLPVALVIGFSCVDAVLRRDKNRMVLMAWAFVPFFLIMMVANGFYSRYFLFIIPPLVLLASLGLLRLGEFLGTSLSTSSLLQGRSSTRSNILLIGLLMGVVLFDATEMGWKLITDPLKAPIHELDRIMHLEGMNSGYGIKEAAQFLESEAGDEPVTLLVPMKPGNSPEGISVYLWRSSRVRQIPVPWWPESERLIPDKPFPVAYSIYRHEPRAMENPENLKAVYFVYPYTLYPEARFLAVNPEFKKVWSFPKPDKTHSIEIFKRISRPE